MSNTPIGVLKLLSVVVLVLAALHGRAQAIDGGIAAPAISSQSVRVIAAIDRSSKVRSAYRALKAGHNDALDWMIKLNEIPAPVNGEQERARLLSTLLLQTGVDEVSIDAQGNVIGLREGKIGARTVAIVAHIDTVFPPGTDVSVRREGNQYFAPGIGDNARGVAMMLALSDALSKADLRPDDNIAFIGSVGEEGLGDLRGVRHLFRAGAEPIDAMIAIDGGKAERLVVRAVGSNRYRVTFRGPGGHSYGSFGRGNPHQALANAIVRFEKAATPISAASGAKATFSIGRIGGGTSINSIPFESWMEVDMRSADPARLALLDDALHTALQQALDHENARRRAGDALTIDIASVGKRPAGQIASDHPLVQYAVAAQRTHGTISVLTASSTDANIPLSLSIPAVTISRGGHSANAHALNESWTDIDTWQTEKSALLLVLAAANFKP